MSIDVLDKINLEAGDYNTDSSVDNADQSTNDGQSDGSQNNEFGNDPEGEQSGMPVENQDNDGQGSEGDGNSGTSSDQDNLSGIERYLAQFDIEGGMIDFDDGTRVHFNDLPPEKQYEVLQDLHSTASVDVEDQYGLSEDEIGLLNYLRSTGATIDDIVDQMATQRLQTYIATQQINSTDISSLDDDAIYTAFLLRSNPDAKPEQLEADLETAKKMSNYKSVVDNLRNTFESERQQLLQRQAEEAKQKTIQEIENQRKEVVEAVSKMQHVDGLLLNDGIKNDVLDLVLTVDEDGDSVFANEVFSDPTNLFKAAFWYKNGPEIMRAREEYWKKEKSAAYKRGIEDAKNGKKTFTENDVRTSNQTRLHYDEPSDTISLDDLYI